MEAADGEPIRRLSEHYTLADFTFSETALRHGIDQSNPPPHIVDNLREVAYVLEDVERLTGFTVRVISGLRYVIVNQLVGGSIHSAHIDGLAADIRCPQFGTPLELCKAIARSNIKYDQCIHEYRSWCHIGLTLGDARKQQLTKEKGNVYRAGLY